MSKKPHRHSSQQIQQLESYFKECQHPDDNQRRQLSMELGLEPKQIKFWFQNKRTQTKAQSEKADNNGLRTENERIHCENLAMREALKSIVCPKCDGPSLGEEERKHGLQLLMMENVQLKEEHERLSTILSSLMGRTVIESPSNGSLHEENNYLPTTAAAGSSSAPIIENQQLETVHRNTFPKNSPTSSLMPNFMLGGGALQEMEKGVMIETVAAAMEEVVELLQADEPLWTRDDEGRFVIHRESYDKLFAKGNYLRSSTAKTESSKDSGIVAATPVELMQMCLDPSKWMDFFPTIVPNARISEVLDSGILGGSLQLMYEKMHVLSPMVAPRDFIFLRYCQQLETNTWVMVDVSYDSFKELDSTSAPSHSWRLPSGCLFQDLHNGKSMVTWVEHVQVDDMLQTHCLYKDLISSGLAYGAKRWIATLQRMSERYGFFLGLTSVPARHELEEVINAPLGRRNMMQLSHRMVRTFYETLSMSDREDLAHDNGGGGVRVSLRRSNHGGQADESLVVCAATSLWLPLPPEHLFNFFKDDKFRAQWDVLSHGYPVTEIARISTGTHPGNCVSIIQPFVHKESNMLSLQESSIISSMEAHLVYAPIELPAITSAINGEDPMKIPILPSGFVICGDGRSVKRSGETQCGSLLTVAFQILMNNSSFSKHVNMECMATVHALVSSTIQKIKAVLDCSELD